MRARVLVGEISRRRIGAHALRIDREFQAGDWPSIAAVVLDRRQVEAAGRDRRSCRSWSEVPDAAMALAMISPCTSRLCTRASIRPARNCDRYSVPTTRATRPATFSETMRRVRLEKRLGEEEPAGARHASASRSR